MKFIAHRALLNGPNKHLENRPSTIDLAIGKGFWVEVDVWLIDDQLYLGHDGPNIPTNRESLLKWAPFAYFHAKNVNALEYLLGSKEFTCFFHDIDEYTITSNGKIWAFPGKRLVPGSICVMPERAAFQDGISKCFAICTDYAELYGIYDDMRSRQLKDLETTKQLLADPLVQSHLQDDRKCIALYTFFDSWKPSPTWDLFELNLKLEFGNQNVYGLDKKDGENVLHFTIMQVLGFDDYVEHSSDFVGNLDKYVNIIRPILEKYLPFKICFRGAMAIKTGLILCGYPSIDINSTIRTEINDQLDLLGLKRRNYMNNIVHSTVVRVSKGELGLSDKLLQFAAMYQDCYFGEVEVSGFDLSKSSWRMRSYELELFDRF